MWEMEVKTIDCSHDKSKMMISRETLTGIKITGIYHSVLMNGELIELLYEF